MCHSSEPDSEPDERRESVEPSVLPLPEGRDSHTEDCEGYGVTPDDGLAEHGRKRGEHERQVRETAECARRDERIREVDLG